MIDMKIRKQNEEQQTDPATQAPEPEPEKSSPPGFTSDTPVQCHFSGVTVTPRNSPVVATSPPQLNRTGMPDGLKSGLERLSGFDLSPVRVYYNSPKPARVGALAYAQGTNIHLGPGQERHLSHEGWHVVQQLQGRVATTVQQKGVRLNDNDGLEREADVMGATALQTGGDMDTLGPAIPAPIQKAAAPVIQRRIPIMTLEFIQANKEMATEILVHAMNNMDQSEFLGMIYATSHPLWWGYDEIVDALQDGSPETVYEWYKLIYEKSGEEKRYQAEVQTEENPNALRTTLINEVVGSSVLPALAQMHGNTDLHVRIFGPECDSTYIKGVIKAIYEALDAHVLQKTCPLQVIGNKEHNEWVGVAGATTHGAKVINIGRGGFNGVLKSSARGLATLVHEFSHAAAGTKDHAYSMASMANLTTPKRMTNAETYAQAFLECFSGPDPARYYDPDKVTDTEKKSSAGKGNIGTRLAGINQLMVELWNFVDNAYGTATLLKKQIDLPSDAIDLMCRSVSAAVYPYQPHLGDYLDTAMALIEDRTKVLKAFMSKSAMRKALQAKKVKKERMEAEISGDRRDYIELAAIAMADHFGLSVRVTEEFIVAALKIDEYGKDAIRLTSEYEKLKKQSSSKPVPTTSTSSTGGLPPPPNDEL